MKFRRLAAVARKEFIHILRDYRSLGLAVAIPIVLLLLFGYALTLDVDRVPLAVWDRSRTPASRDFLSRFSGSRYFSLGGGSDNYRGLERAIDTSQALMALVIPSDFADRLDSHRSPTVQLLVDGSDSNTATIAMNYAQAIVQDYSQRVAVDALGRLAGRSVALPQPLELRPRVWFNPRMESKNSIVPGLIVVILMIIAALLTSLTVAGEWERGTMEQLISTPIKRSELILGKLIPYFVIGMFDMLLSVLMGKYLFGVPLRGSVALLFGIAALFMIGAQSLGILASAAARSQLAASQLAILVTFVPSFLLSGFMYPIDNMPRVVQWITCLVPARYFIVVLRGIYLKGVGLEVLAVEALLLTIFAAAMVTAAIRKFRKKLA